MNDIADINFKRLLLELEDGILTLCRVKDRLRKQVAELEARAAAPAAAGPISGTKLKPDSSGRVILDYWPKTCPICGGRIRMTFGGWRFGNGKGLGTSVCQDGHAVDINVDAAGETYPGQSFYRPTDAPIKPSSNAREVHVLDYRPSICPVENAPFGRCGCVLQTRWALSDGSGVFECEVGHILKFTNSADGSIKSSQYAPGINDAPRNDNTAGKAFQKGFSGFKYTGPLPESPESRLPTPVLMLLCGFLTGLLLSKTLDSRSGR